MLHKRGALTEPEAKRLARQLLDALAHLHARRIIHRDVKPANLVLTAPVTYTQLLPRHTALKLIDFGLARRLPPADQPVHLVVDAGTRAYAAPELRSTSRLRLVSATPIPATCAAGVDCYSAGATVRELLTGTLPSLRGLRLRERPVLASVIRAVIARMRGSARRRVSVDFCAAVSVPARALVDGLMAPQIHARTTAAAALGHPWLVDCDDDD